MKGRGETGEKREEIKLIKKSKCTRAYQCITVKCSVVSVINRFRGGVLCCEKSKTF